jgi:hypothetical protein
MPNLQEVSGPGVMWCSRVTYLTVLIGGVDPFGLGAQHLGRSLTCKHIQKFGRKLALFDHSTFMYILFTNAVNHLPETCKESVHLNAVYWAKSDVWLSAPNFRYDGNFSIAFLWIWGSDRIQWDSLAVPRSNKGRGFRKVWQRSQRSFLSVCKCKYSVCDPEKHRNTRVLCEASVAGD